MSPLLPSPELLHVARRVVWFKESAETLNDPLLFLAHVMTYGTADDVAAVRAVVGLPAFAEVLDSAPPGIFDARSWSYWHVMCGRPVTPPLPIRRGIGLEARPSGRPSPAK